MYTYITENVAIGSSESSYDPFDIIVNLNYPFNGVKEDEFKVEVCGNKLLMNCGVIDDKNMRKMIDRVMLLLHKVKTMRSDGLIIFPPIPNILFHCCDGIVRSATIAIVYLSFYENISMKKAYDMVSEKREVKPNLEILKLKI